MPRGNLPDKINSQPSAPLKVYQPGTDGPSPHNCDAERRLLSGILRDPHTLINVEQILIPSSFYFDAHQKIFQAICDLRNEGRPPDLALLHDKLRRNKHLDDVGGSVYLSDLFDLMPTGANAEHHAILVREAANSRGIVHLGNWLLAQGHEPSGSTDEIVQRAKQWLDSFVSSDSEQKLDRSPAPISWPTLDSAAIIGPAGELVKAIEPHTEADPVGILFQILIGFGNMIGRTAYFQHEADRHYGNEFVVLVGETGDGRKGTSWGHARRALAIADPEWTRERIARGLSSGEGLIHEVRDSLKEDGGVPDKRLLVMENEFASVLKVIDRQGNTLSPVLRQAWESGELRTLTKNTPARCAAPHISVIGHITGNELHRYLTATEVANGLGNRHLFVCVRRSKELPEGGTPDLEMIEACGMEVGYAAAYARQVAVVTRDDEARALWKQEYSRLSACRPGLVGSLAARCLAHVTRLAMLYALLDREPQIGARHLRAAIACWDYCEASLRYIFGDNLGDPTADQIRTALLDCKNGMTRTEIRNFFGRNKSGVEIDRALALLQKWNLAYPRTVSTAGRPAERWFAAGL